MRTSSVCLSSGLALAALLLLSPVDLLADVSEVEPNDSCQTAQYVGYLSTFPVSVYGSLDADYGTDPTTFDVDYFGFEAEPGTLLDARVLGASSEGGTLADPVLGLFNSDCELIAFNDDSPDGLDPRIRLEVPEDGVFILGASGFPDYGLSGGHWQEGSYTLAVGLPPPSIGSISGRVVDSVTGAGLSGYDTPYAYVQLNRCHDGSCWQSIAFGQPDQDGYFIITTNHWEHPIEAGSFLLEAWASEYQPASAGPFAVGEGEHIDLGDIALVPPPVAFGTVIPCEDIPAGGGICRYSVEVHNNTAEQLQGLAWSNVQAWGTGSLLGYSNFTVSRAPKVNLKALSGGTLRFSFNVPAGVADYATFCVDAWVSDRDEAFFGSIRTQQLFCIQKLGPMFLLLEERAARAYVESRREPGPALLKTRQAD